MSKVDLQLDSRRVERFIQKRVRGYHRYVNVGPGDDDDPVVQVVLGYYVADAAYVSLVFDTRPDASSDGEWTRYLRDETLLYFPKWVAAGDALFDGRRVELTTQRGARKTLSPDSEADDLSVFVGKMLADLMRRLRRQKFFEALPLAQTAFMLVEDFGGGFSWPSEYERIRTQGRLRL